MQRNQRQQAFTLVELAIVMVIIGFLVGGVMVGKDLISGGEAQKQVAQVNQYKTAINSFRDKYNGLPGDLKAQTANGFQMITRSGAAGHGDGNGRIEGCAPNATNAGCETVLFWTDLSFAGLISPSLNGAADTPIQMAAWEPPAQTWQQLIAAHAPSLNPISDAQALVGLPAGCMSTCICYDPVSGTTNSVADTSPGCDCTGMCSPSTPASVSKDDYIPHAAIGDNNIAVYTDGSANFFQIAGIVSTDAAGVYSLRNALSPKDALSIDTKLDDGAALTGSVRAVGGPGPLGVAAVAGAGNCVTTSTGNPYNTVTDALASSLLCQLSIRH